MKNSTNNQLKAMSKKKRFTKIAAFSTALAIGILSISSVVSCSSVNTNSANSSINNTINTYDGAKGFTSLSATSLNNVAKSALESNSGSKQELNAIADQIVYNWFANNTNQNIQRTFSSIKTSAQNSYNSQISSYKKQYGNNWQYYFQNNVLDPTGGTEQTYLLSNEYSTMQTDLQQYLFPNDFNYLGFAQITKTNSDGQNVLLPYSQWQNSHSLLSDAFINNPVNWAANGNNNNSLGFFPNDIITPKLINWQYCNFDQFIFDQWVINESPMIASALLYKYAPTSSGNNNVATNIYNSTYFTSASADLQFPYFGNGSAQSLFQNTLYKFLTTGVTKSNNLYVSSALNNWTGNASVYNANGYTGGLNFYTYQSTKLTQAKYVGYLITRSTMQNYVPSFISALVNRYNILMYNNNQNYAVNAGVGGEIYNGFANSDLNSNLLENFFFSYGSGNGTNTGSYLPSYSTTQNIPSQSYSIINPRFTTLLYKGDPLNSSNLTDFWNPSATNPFIHDTIGIKSFNLIYPNNQLSPYIFTLDQDGVHVESIDGYDRIIAAENNIKSIASPIDVYPNPINSYEAATDAIAQDILWRAVQKPNSINNDISLNISSLLSQYLQNNFAALVIEYALQDLNSSTSSNYNPLFASAYNLFSTNNINSVIKVNGNNTNAFESLVYSIVTLQNYLTDQSNENAFKSALLKYGSSASNNIGANFASNGALTVLPYDMNISSTILYPYLSLYNYQMLFNNTLFIPSVTQNNYVANQWLNQTKTNTTTSSSFTNTDQPIKNLDQQTTSLSSDLNSSIINFVQTLNLSAWNYSSSYAKYSQYVFTNNTIINSVIETLSSNSLLALLVQNNIIANNLGISNTTTLNNSSDYGLNSNQSVFSNSVFSTTDANYGNISYLTTALIYESFLNTFAANAANAINYGYNLDLNPNSYIPTSHTTYMQDIASITQTINNFYNQTNFVYGNSGLNFNSSFNNQYLTLLDTINYLYDNGTWTNLWNYLNSVVTTNNLAYVVWLASENTNNIWSSSNQYVNQLNNASNPSYPGNSNSNATNAIAYAQTGYTLANNISQYAYGPFNYIPNANLNGSMFNEFSDQNIAQTATIYGQANLAFNNITTYATSLSQYFNMANVQINANSTNGTQNVPFIGFMGLQTSVNNSALPTSVVSQLFNMPQYSINGDGVLANYTGLGNDPTSASINQPLNSLMYTIMHATSINQLQNIYAQVKSAYPNLSLNIQNSTNAQSNDLNFAQAVYQQLNEIPTADGGYSKFFNNFVGFVTDNSSALSGTAAKNEGFNNNNDLYEAETGGGLGLPYNNLQSANMSSLLSNKQTKPGASTISNLANARVINNQSGGSLNYVVYASQISKSSLGNTPWTNFATPVWTKLGLTQDAFLKLVVQIASSNTEQKLAINALVNNNKNKVTVYDIRFKNELGALWVLNWDN